MHANTFQVTARTHVLRRGTVRTHMPVGSAVDHAIRQIIPPGLHDLVHAELNGVRVPFGMWASVKPKAGTILSLNLVPQRGGGSKNPVSMVLTVALAFAAPYLGAQLAMASGMATATAAGGMISWNVMGFSGLQLATGIASAVGRLAISAIAPPSAQRGANTRKADPADSPTQFIAGGRNQPMKWGRIPRVLGRTRMVPPYGAQPYTEVVGNDQYVRMLFVWGYGPLDISDIRIGTTPLSEYKGVEIETRQGYDDDEPLTLFTNDVQQNDLSIVLRALDGWQLRTTATNIDEISIDLTFARGLTKFNNAGKKTDREVELEVEYAEAGTGNWTDLSGYKVVSTQTSAVMRAPAAVRGNQAEVLWKVSVDKLSGKILLAAGKAFVHGTDTGSPQAPATPVGFWPVATVRRRTGDPDIIDAAAITDIRDPSLIGPVFNGAGDFQVTPDLTANKVVVAAGGMKGQKLVITGKQTNALRYSQRWTVPSGQYDVRIRRVTADTNDEKILDEASWTALRSLRHVYPINFPGLAVTALRIKATDQLNGIVDQLNGIVHSIVPDWDGSQWVMRGTSNPASLYRSVLQGKGNARPLADNRVDIEALQDWHADNAANDREFNIIVDYNTSVREILSDIAAAGRASPAVLDARWTVVQDKPKVSTQVFAARNVREFEFKKLFPDRPHALRVQFKNEEKDWEDDEVIVYDDGYDEINATKFESLRLVGVTNRNQAWRDGRYHIATARLRPEIYSFMTGIEHINSTRGDVISVAHDIIAVGVGSARVKYATVSEGLCTAIVADDSFVMQGDKTYSVRIRRGNGTQSLYTLAAFNGETRVLTLETPIDEDLAPTRSDLLVVGEIGQETIELIIHSIEPQSDMSARITCLDAAPGVHNADHGVIPPYNPVISYPVDLLRPPAPVLATLQSGKELLINAGETSYLNAISIMLKPPAFPLPVTAIVNIKGVTETLYRPAEVNINDNRITITDVEIGQSYDIRLIYRTDMGKYSAETTISGHTVAGGNDRPGNVQNFNGNFLGDFAHLSWSPATDMFLSHYTIRYVEDPADARWESAVTIVQRIGKPSTSVTVPSRSGAYLIKAVGTNGRESDDFAVVTSNVAALNGFNAVEDVIESKVGDDLGFHGAMDNVVFYGMGIHLATATTVEGIYYFANDVDLGHVYTSRLTATQGVESIDLANNFDLIGNIDLVENIDGNTGSSEWEVQLQLRTTEDDPSDSPAWTDWKNFIIGDYTARAYQFRIILRSMLAGISPFVYELKVGVDMPDRTDGRRALVSDATDLPATTVLFGGGPFKALPAVAITAHNLDAGDNHEITNQTPAGFDVVFRNGSGTRITRTFDYVAQGYGTEI